MKGNPHFLYSTSIAALLAIIGTFGANPVLAQQAGSNTLREVVVKAKPVTYERTDAMGRVTETVTLERHVSYADLDLRKHADVVELNNRIKTNAKEACKEVDKMHPIDRWTNAEMQHCIKRAIESANAGLKEAIAAAQ